MTFDWKVVLFCPCKLFSFYISIKLNVKIISYLMFIRYCASATDSAFPVIVMVRSIFVLFPLTFGSRSSQFDMRIIAPLSCLQVQNDINGMHQTIKSTSKLQFFRNLCQSNAVKSFYKLKKATLFQQFLIRLCRWCIQWAHWVLSFHAFAVLFVAYLVDGDQLVPPMLKSRKILFGDEIKLSKISI